MTDVLFTPFTLKSLTTRNRIVMAPMTRNSSPEGVPGDDVAAYHAARAAGGAGLIVSEAIAIDHRTAAEGSGIPILHSKEARAGWRRVVGAVHDAGGRIAAQIYHSGALRDAEKAGAPDVANSAPADLSDAEISDIVLAFGTSAAYSKQLGFDAIEVHGAHGNLIDLFLWRDKNTRSDRWGGDISDRTRFAVEIVRAICAAIGPELPLLFRTSQFKIGAYHAKLANDPAELEKVLGPLVDAGVDAFDASQRRFWEPAFDGSPLNLAGWAKKVTGKPTITVGSVGLEGPDVGDLLTGKGGNAGPSGLDEVRRRLEAGEFDLVAVGRALLTDPTWPEKVRDGRLQDLRGFETSSLASLVSRDPALPAIA